MRPGQPISIGPLAGRVLEVKTRGERVCTVIDTLHGRFRAVTRARWRGLVLITPEGKGT